MRNQRRFYLRVKLWPANIPFLALVEYDDPTKTRYALSYD